MITVFYFEDMLYPHIKDSKLILPNDLENYSPEEYPHFHVFRLLHIGRSIDISTLESNANIIAEIPMSDIKNVTLEQLLEKGLWIENSTYLI